MKSADVYVGEIKPVLFIKTRKMLAFEFHTEDSIEIDNGDDLVSDYFRLECFNDEITSKVISVASEEEYCVHEECTFLFDLDKVYEICMKEYDANNLEDATTLFLEYVEEEEGHEEMLAYL